MNIKRWEVYYMPAPDDENTRYFFTKWGAKKYYEKKVRSCNICGKGKWCDFRSAEWGYDKRD